MPQYARTPDPLERIARLEERLAALEQASPPVRDELPFYPTTYDSMPWSDATDWNVMWETTITPRGAALQLNLITIGDQVDGVNTGGEWRINFGSTTVATGSVLANFSYQRPTNTLDLTPYRGDTSLIIGIHVRRTSGATTGGRYGGGGAIGIAPLTARLS